MTSERRALGDIGWIIALLAGVMILAPLGQTIYAPSMAVVRDALSTTNALVGASVAVYGLGLALSQIVYGPMVDRYDAKWVLLGGVLIYIVGAIVGLFAPTIDWLIAGRGVQALGIGAGMVVGPAMIGDLVPAARRGAAMGVFSSITMIGPVVGPIAGSVLAAVYSWRIDFLALALCATFSGILALRYLPNHRAHGIVLSGDQIRAVLLTPTMMSCGALGFAQFATMHGFLSFLPVLFRDRFGLPEVAIGPLLTSMTLVMAATATFGGRLSDRVGRRAVILLGSAGSVLGTLAVLAMALLTQPGNLLPAVGSMALLGISISISAPTQMSLVVDWFPELRGTAIAVFNFLRFLGGVAGPLLGGVLADQLGTSWAFLPGVVASVVAASLVAVFLQNPPAAASGRRAAVAAEAG